jgi:DNA-binding transcriptional ArsR family regulator
MTIDNTLDRALQAIADPTRRNILQALKQAVAPVSSRVVGRTSPPPLQREGAGKSSHRKPCLCAGEIQRCVRLTQPTISHHMSILTRAGLVEESKQGQWRWYSRNEIAIRKLLKVLRTKL